MDTKLELFAGMRVVNSVYGEGIILAPRSDNKTIRVAFRSRDGFFLFPNAFYSRPPRDLSLVDESSYKLFEEAFHNGKKCFEFEGQKYYFHSVDQPFRWKSLFDEYITGALSDRISDAYEQYLLETGVTRYMDLPQQETTTELSEAEFLELIDHMIPWAGPDLEFLAAEEEAELNRVGYDLAQVRKLHEANRRDGIITHR